MPTVPTIQPWVKPYERERLGRPDHEAVARRAARQALRARSRRARGRARRDRIPGGRLWLQLRPRSASGDACWRSSAACSAACSASPAARAADLPENKAEALIHSYSGGGVNAYGPAFLVRKSIFDKVSLTGTYYIDAVSNASIDVVTTASPYKETRHEFGLSADYVYRDAQITFGLMTSHEPDYVANTGNLDVTQEVFGGMTTVAFGFTRAQRHGQEAQRARVQGQRATTGSTASASPRS